MLLLALICWHVVTGKAQAADVRARRNEEMELKRREGYEQERKRLQVD